MNRLPLLPAEVRLDGRIYEVETDGTVYRVGPATGMRAQVDERELAAEVRERLRERMGRARARLDVLLMGGGGA